jgi:transcriptional regulator with XRE-family HTH domain
MSLRANLARNLQMLCSRVGSTNSVCRQLGINRQQFEKYIKGRSLPAAATLEKICDYFDVTEELLFSENFAPASERQRGARATKGPCDETLRPLFGEPFASIKPGIYFLWLTVPTEPGQVVCAPVFIERGRDAMTFRRVTGSGESRERIWWHRVGDHKGIVVERLAWLIFVAVNQRGNAEPSMVRLRWVPLSAAVLGGHATILTPTGISFAAACMRPAPAGTTVRRALRQSRKISTDDPSIDAMTRTVIDQQRRELVEIIARDVSL